MKMNNVGFFCSVVYFIHILDSVVTNKNKTRNLNRCSSQRMPCSLQCNQEESNNVTPDQAENFQNSDIIH